MPKKQVLSLGEQLIMQATEDDLKKARIIFRAAALDTLGPHALDITSFVSYIGEMPTIIVGILATLRFERISQEIIERAKVFP